MKPNMMQNSTLSAEHLTYQEEPDQQAPYLDN